MDLKHILEGIKLSPKYLLALSLVSGFLIFANSSLLAVFGLTNFVKDARFWIGIIFLLSIMLLVSHTLFALGSLIKSQIRKFLKIRKMHARLYSLTPEEKNILLEYMRNDTRTCYFEFSDGRITELIYYDILYRSSNVGNLTNWPVNIQPWAWDFLHKHQQEIFPEEPVTKQSYM